MSNLLASLDPIFKDCVAPKGWPDKIQQPWIQDGFVYATDGRIVVRQPIELSDTTHDAQDARAIFDESKPGISIDLPDIGPEQPRLQCPHCKAAFTNAGCVERTPRAVELHGGLFIADRFVWLLLRHGISEIRLDTARHARSPSGQRYSFCKGTIEGLLMGRDPDKDCVGDGDE